MAIKIITEPKIKPNGKYKALCPKCGIELEYLGCDVRTNEDFPSGYVTCPKCGFELQHSESYFTGQLVDQEVVNKQRRKGLILFLIILCVALLLVAGLTILGLKILKII